MFNSRKANGGSLNPRFLTIIVIALALAVFIITLVGIRESREDSLQLLIEQGTAFTEALAQASENAISSEVFYDRLVEQRYSDLVETLTNIGLDRLTQTFLSSFAQNHDILAIQIYGMDMQLISEGYARGPRLELPDFVQDEVKQLFENKSSSYVLLFDESDTGSDLHYYLQLSARMEEVYVLVMDARYYSEAVHETGIGYLAQKMAREKGVSYIIYQSTEGIIFASRKPGNLLAIESDPFLSKAIDEDTISNRIYDFQGQKVLELVRPFSSERYPFGVFRVGLSLDRYYNVSRGFDQQMIILAVVLFVLLLVILLYFNSKRKRREISRKYTQMKTITDKIFEEMRIGVAVIDSLGVVRIVNAAFEKILGLNNISEKEWEVVVDDELLKKQASFENMGTGDEVEFNIVVQGAQKNILMARSRVEESLDEQASLVLVVYDITRLREFERTSMRKERLSEMGNLAAGVAHEIRNPLNTISIAAQRLAGEFKPEEKSEEFLSFTDKIRAETKRLNDIITRFLALARESKPQYQILSLKDGLNEFERFIEDEASKNKIKVQLNIGEDVSIEAEPDKLQQVFLNLFNNTREALQGKPGEIRIEIKTIQSSVQIDYVDSGPGIKPELREKVFTPYFTTKEAGTGLGLPTVHKIIGEFGGDIKALESDRGALFRITLPVSKSHNSSQ